MHTDQELNTQSIFSKRQKCITTKTEYFYLNLTKIPNIEAESLHDGYFALGFAHAEDRLWQMYFNYKVAMGEVSEVNFSNILDVWGRRLNC